MISRILAAAAEDGSTPNPLLPAEYDILWSSVVFVILLVFFWFRVLPCWLQHHGVGIKINLVYLKND